MVKTMLASLLLLASLAAAQPPINDILKTMQDNISINTDVRAMVSMTQLKADQGTKLFEMAYYRRDRDDAFLIAFSAPE
jgi:hypothetical protein